MRDPACKRGPASIRSFTVYVYELNTRQRTKGGTLSTLQYNFSNFGAIAVHYSDVSFPILGYLNRVYFLGMGNWGGGPRGPPLNTPLLQTILKLRRFKQGLQKLAIALDRKYTQGL